jgi:phosphohistidine phosphatase
MRLFVMRHGPAESTAQGQRDFDRVLSPEGRDRVHRNALALRQRGEPIERICASPLVRTQQTAEIVAQVFGNRAVELREELAPSENMTALVQEVVSAVARPTLFVGHAPDVSDLVTTLTGEHLGGFEPGTIVALAWSDGHATRVYTVR